MTSGEPCVALGDQAGHLTEDGRFTLCARPVQLAASVGLVRRAHRMNRCRRCYPVASGPMGSIEVYGQPSGPRPPAPPRAPVRMVAGGRSKRRKPKPSIPAPLRVELEPNGWAELQDMCRRLDAAANAATRASQPRSALQ